MQIVSKKLELRIPRDAEKAKQVSNPSALREPVAKSVGKPDAGNRHVRMSGEGKPPAASRSRSSALPRLYPPHPKRVVDSTPKASARRAASAPTPTCIPKSPE